MTREVEDTEGGIRMMDTSRVATIQEGAMTNHQVKAAEDIDRDEVVMTTEVAEVIVHEESRVEDIIVKVADITETDTAQEDNKEMAVVIRMTTNGRVDQEEISMNSIE